MKKYTIIEYKSEECYGLIAIKNYTYDKKHNMVSNKKYVDKVMKNLAKNKFKMISCYECDEYE